MGELSVDRGIVALKALAFRHQAAGQFLQQWDNRADGVETFPLFPGKKPIFSVRSPVRSILGVLGRVAEQGNDPVMKIVILCRQGTGVIDDRAQYAGNPFERYQISAGKLFAFFDQFGEKILDNSCASTQIGQLNLRRSPLDRMKQPVQFVEGGRSRPLGGKRRETLAYPRDIGSSFLHEKLNELGLQYFCHLFRPLSRRFSRGVRIIMFICRDHPVPIISGPCYSQRVVARSTIF
ncbi:MAG: hypothetical protein ACD_75C02074G0001 [uncultured bacterium]|nr:MAG: hypothetical protein ACD_75C02074G0001 [uncultured bacterium]